MRRPTFFSESQTFCTGFGSRLFGSFTVLPILLLLFPFIFFFAVIYCPKKHISRQVKSERNSSHASLLWTGIRKRSARKAFWFAGKFNEASCKLWETRSASFSSYRGSSQGLVQARTLARCSRKSKKAAPEPFFWFRATFSFLSTIGQLKSMQW